MPFIKTACNHLVLMSNGLMPKNLDGLLGWVSCLTIVASMGQELWKDKNPTPMNLINGNRMLGEYGCLTVNTAQGVNLLENRIRNLNHDQRYHNKISPEDCCKKAGRVQAKMVPWWWGPTRLHAVWQEYHRMLQPADNDLVTSWQ